jgi:hypothetical protein
MPIWLGVIDENIKLFFFFLMAKHVKDENIGRYWRWGCGIFLRSKRGTP